jgi:adenylate cyclase class 2
MQFEVEQKHRIDDERSLLERLAERGVEIGRPVEQSDRYFAHPCRDFSQTDEALRIRTVGGDKSFVTFKGPKVDKTTKTRREIELPLSASDTDGTKFGQLLHELGFRAVAVVRKRRRTFHLNEKGHRIEGALDEVDGVGKYVELELLSEQSGLADSKRVISALASELQLGPLERRSYLEMMLENIAKLVSN